MIRIVKRWLGLPPCRSAISSANTRIEEKPRHGYSCSNQQACVQKYTPARYLVLDSKLHTHECGVVWRWGVGTQRACKPIIKLEYNGDACGWGGDVRGAGKGRPSSPQELRQGDKPCSILKRQHIADIRAVVDEVSGNHDAVRSGALDLGDVCWKSSCIKW
jgi:hypothetical protein